MINENKIPSSYSVKEKIVHGELKKLLGGLAFTTYDVRAGSLEALFKKAAVEENREPRFQEESWLGCLGGTLEFHDDIVASNVENEGKMLQ